MYILSNPIANEFVSTTAFWSVFRVSGDSELRFIWFGVRNNDFMTTRERPNLGFGKRC